MFLYQKQRPTHRAQWTINPRTGVVYDRMAVGAQPQVEPDPTPEQEINVRDALKRITPTLILVGIITGASFAIGSGLVSRYLFGEKRK